MIVGGIDPGRTGAIALLSNGIPKIWPLPVKNGKIQSRILLHWLQNEVQEKIDLLMIEQVYVPNLMVMQKRKISPYKIAMLNRNAVTIECLCEILQIPFQIVPALRWKSRVLVGMSWRKNKHVSVEYVGRKYPTIKLRRTPRCKNVWIDGADAICIAEYGGLVVSGNN